MLNIEVDYKLLIIKAPGEKGLFDLLGCVCVCLQSVCVCVFTILTLQREFVRPNSRRTEKEKVRRVRPKATLNWG